MSEFKPNTTPYPNFLFEIMHTLCESEIKVLNAIVRKTYGWHKEKDKISLSQMMKLTGLSRQACHDGKEGLIAKGIIQMEVIDGISEYMVVVPDQSIKKTSLLETKEPVYLGDQGGLLETKKVVVEVDSQKKEYTKEILQKKGTKKNEVINFKQDTEDPFFPKHDFDGTKFVHRILYDNCKDKYQSAIVSDPTHCNAIFNLLISDDKEQELKEKLLQYAYSWYGEHQIQPNAKNVFKSWDKLSPDKVPLYARKGYKTESEMTFALRREREQIADLQRQTRVKTVVDEGFREQVIEAGDQLLKDFEQMKKEFA
jgi:phage replication O-like protein O